MAVAKMGLSALVRERGREFIEKPEFEPVCAFAFGSDETPPATSVQFSARKVFREWAGAELGDHILCIWDSHVPSGDVIEAAFVAFGIFPYRVQLAANIRVDETIVHIVKPSESKYNEGRRSESPPVPEFGMMCANDDRKAGAALSELFPLFAQIHGDTALEGKPTDELRIGEARTHNDYPNSPIFGFDRDLPDPYLAIGVVLPNPQNTRTP